MIYEMQAHLEIQIPIIDWNSNSIALHSSGLVAMAL